MMEALVMLLSAEMPVEAMANLIDEHDTRLWRVGVGPILRTGGKCS
jgi:hypothetical protein